MMTEELKISQKDMRLLLSAASPDAALLYLYLKGGNELRGAPGELHLNESRLSGAEATLRQLGLMTDDRVSHIAPGERPGYSEKDVLEAMDGDPDFRGLYGEVQRLLGRSLNTEELKILLGGLCLGGAGYRLRRGRGGLYSGPECSQFPTFPADESASDPGQESYRRRGKIRSELAGYGFVGGTDYHGL